MNAIKATLLAGAFYIPTFGMAEAQTQAIEDSQSGPLADAPAEGDASIIVTGTRLQNSGFQAPTPVTVLGAENIEQRAPTSISDIVNDLPAFRLSATNTQAQRRNGNGGQNRVDLRGLGEERTLSLVDGRRFVPTNLNGTLDINVIPVGLIDRVEVVTGGASAAYGSDAVSGVVNFILKDRMEGVKLTAQYGVSARGDNIEPSINFAAGLNFADDRAHFIVGGDYSNNKGISTLYSRGWGRKQPCLFSYGSLAGRGDNPAQGFANNCTYSQQSDGGLINSGPLAGTAFDADGNPFQMQYGTVYSNLMVGGNNGPDANPFGNWNIRAPTERLTGMAKFTFEVADPLTLYVQFSAARMNNKGLSSYHQLPNIIVPISNPFIPDSVREAMVDNGLTSIKVGRYETQLGGYQLRQTQDIWEGVVGARGKLGAGWAYDVSYAKGSNNGHQIVDTNIFEGNYLAAIYVVNDANGNPVCGPLDTNPNLSASRRAEVLPGCVPFNIFGRYSPSQAAVDYVRRRSDNRTHYDQDVFSATVTGEPFSTWAGPVSFATGFEHRKESAYSQADQYQGYSLSNNGSTYSGEIAVNEGFAEIGVPLIADASFTKSLDLNGAIRRTHYSTSGSVTTWKLGATWEPIDAVRVRVTRSRDIRAANITELFQTRSQGIIASFLNPVTSQTGPVNTISGGNPNLTPEIAQTWTAGIVLSPGGFLNGLRFSVDYFNVKIADVIATFGPEDIVRRCAANLPGYCDLITFDTSAASGIREIQITPANLNGLKTDGVDIELDYHVPMDSIGIPGRMDLRSLTTFTNHLTTSDGTTSLDRAGSGALGGVPTWVNNTTLTYGIDAFSTTLQMKYTSAIKGDASLVGPDDPAFDPGLPNSVNINHYPAAAYFNWTLQWEVEDGSSTYQFFAIVNNLFDKQPPDYAIAAFSQGGNPFDVIGRTYKIGVRLAF